VKPLGLDREDLGNILTLAHTADCLAVTRDAMADELTLLLHSIR
jgi:hypothetical protein